MSAFDYRPKDGTDPQGKYRVYFTCHPDDFSLYFDKICTDILRTHKCVIYYTKDMSAELEAESGRHPLEDMTLFVVPVTMKLLSAPNRAMDSDIAFAKSRGVRILPFMMEGGKEILDLYSQESKFGKIQCVNPFSTDITEMDYRDKLKNCLDAVLAKNELLDEIRAAFYAQMFLSYRKKDREYANKLMKLIHDIPGCRDISIWYDEFIVFGEDWRESIWEAMRNSSLFTVLVTSNLLEEKNFVMEQEYPRAKDEKMDILPVRMCELDGNDGEVLNYKLKPHSIITPEDENFKKRLLGTLADAAISESDDQRHNFLIGLAYLDGIGVEIDKARGMKLITDAAEAGVAEAVEKMIALNFGDDVGSMHARFKWQEKLLEIYKKKYGPRDKRLVPVMEELAWGYLNFASEEKLVAHLKEKFDIERDGLDDDDPDMLAAIAAAHFWNINSYKRITGEDLGPILFSRITSPECKVNKNLFKSLRGVINLFLTMFEDEYSALEWERAICELKRRTLPENDEEILLSLNSIANILGRIDSKSPEALAAKIDAYNAYRRAFGENSEKALAIAIELGCTYLKYGEHGESKKILEKARDAACDTFGRDHYLADRALYELACIDRRLGEYGAAARTLLDVYEWRRLHLGDFHKKTIIACMELGEVYCSSREYDKAISVLKKAQDLISEANKRNRDYDSEYSLWWQEQIYDTLVTCYLGMEQYREAYACQKEVCYYADMRNMYEETEETEQAREKLKRIKLMISGE